ncbi:MAG TPA: winged helix DNA-binding domain-containing protein [Methanocella sp.]
MRSSDILVASREQALAFRIDSHHLAVRLPPGSLLVAAGTCGIQDSPPGSAAIALHARVSGLTPAAIEQATTADRSLVRAWCLRAAPCIFPASDAAVFTAGLLPDDEAATRFFILGSNRALDMLGMSAGELIDMTAAETCDLLDGRTMTKDRLGIEIADTLAKRLTVSQRTIWQSDSFIAPGQSLGESLVRFALYVLPLRGLICFASRQGNTAYLTRIDQWLGTPLPVANAAKARAELVVRYLHCYGPSTDEHFSRWAGISPAQASRAWALIEDGLIDVDIDGKETWLLPGDLPRFRSPRPAAGVRFLPPHEPLLQMRDRETLIPDKSLHRKLWRSVGNPGILLADGKAVAAWRSRKSGKRMDLTIEQFSTIPQEMRPDIEAEAATLAPFSGCVSVRVEYK